VDPGEGPHALGTDTKAAQLYQGQDSSVKSPEASSDDLPAFPPVEACSSQVPESARGGIQSTWGCSSPAARGGPLAVADVGTLDRVAGTVQHSREGELG
jgi:hypothetical protein